MKPQQPPTTTLNMTFDRRIQSLGVKWIPKLTYASDRKIRQCLSVVKCAKHINTNTRRHICTHVRTYDFRKRCEYSIYTSKRQITSISATKRSRTDVFILLSKLTIPHTYIITLNTSNTGEWMLTLNFEHPISKNVYANSQSGFVYYQP